MAIYPVIMCGGAGTRLWPASRPMKPKQFIAFASARTLFQDTVLRVAALADQGGALIIVAGAGHERLIREQLAPLNISAHIILEPQGRDSAPAMTAAALWTQRVDPEGVNVFVSSDHYLPDSEAFQDSAKIACASAEQGRIVTLGVKPNAPSTAYGYIQPSGEGLSEVIQFVEKPDVSRAMDFIAKGYVWNTGIFVSKASVLIDEIRLHAPGILESVDAALPKQVSSSRSLLSGVFAESPKISIDYAVMEHTRRASVLKVDFDWSDLGAWDSVATAGTPNHARHVLIDSEGSLVRAPDDVVVSLVGAKDLAVVVEHDAVLVCDLARSQDVKHVVERIREKSPEHLDFPAKEGNLFSEGQRFLSWMKLRALPLWSSLGRRSDGMFCEALTFNGDPVECDHRIRVQARQIFVFTQAGKLGWQGPWKQIVTSGREAFQQYCCAPSGGLHGLLSPFLEVRQQDASVYDNAFGIFAMAHAYEMGIDPENSQKLAKDLMVYLLGLADEHGALVETVGFSRQSNCHMHLLEACLAWEQVSDDPIWADAADRFANLALSIFIDPQIGCLREYFGSDWAPAPGIDGQRVEPGHQFEWAWLLANYAKRRNRLDVMKTALRLYDVGRLGWWPEARVVADAMDPHGQITEFTARLWPQTEWLRIALFLAAGSEGEMRERYIHDAEQALVAVNRYLTTEGLWYDQLLDVNIFDTGDVRASSFYHIMGACHQMVESFKALGIKASLGDTK